MLLSTALLYTTLGACAVLVGWLAYRYDLYDREPWYMLVLATVLGAGAMWLAGKVQGVIIRATESPVLLVDEVGSSVFFATLAATTEEFAKLAVVLIIMAGSRKYFNDPLDGVIYGSFAGLGAAIEESILVLNSSEPGAFLPGTEPIRLAGHLIMGGIGAAALGMVPAGRPRAARWTLLTFAAAVAVHFLWDVVAFRAADASPGGTTPRLGHSVAGIVIMLTGLVVFRRLVAIGARHSKAAFSGRGDESGAAAGGRGGDGGVTRER